jgi:uncharacterized membrane protein YozB (DUF420 family)
MQDFLTSPGFLGTEATLRADLTLVLILITALLFNIGFYLVRRKNFIAHRWVQTTSVVLNSAVVLITMVSSYIIHILPGIPEKLGQGDYAVTSLHAIIGAIGLVLGVFVTLRGNGLVPKALRFSNYKLFMRWAYALYMLGTLSGVVIYIVVYILGI